MTDDKEQFNKLAHFIATEFIEYGEDIFGNYDYQKNDDHAYEKLWEKIEEYKKLQEKLGNKND